MVRESGTDPLYTPEEVVAHEVGERTLMMWFDNHGPQNHDLLSTAHSIAAAAIDDLLLASHGYLTRTERSPNGLEGPRTFQHLCLYPQGALTVNAIAVVVWLLLGSGATDGAGTKLLGRQSGSPCDTLSGIAAVRRVQASLAFLSALEAARRYYNSPLRSATVARYCRTMTVVTSPSIEPLTVVKFPTPGGMADMYVWFGVSDDRVTLLNVIDKGVLTQGLDLGAWNAFVHASRDLAPLTDPGQVLSYACFVFSLASLHHPTDVCDWERRIVVEKGDSGIYSVTLPHAQRTVRVTQDRTVLALPFL